MTTNIIIDRHASLIRIRKRNGAFLRLVSTILIGAFSFQCVVPAYAVSYESPHKTESLNAAKPTAPAGAKRAFARTAKKGHFDVKAIRESGEHGGGLTPTTEDVSRFTTEGNEAFGACMQLWNGHRWEKAAAAMRRFASDYSRDPWQGEARLHLACYHYFRGEYAEAEEILVPLYEQNVDNPIGRKALVRLGRVYFDTFRYQVAYEAFSTLLQMDPTENEKSFAVNWLFHVSRAWMYAAESRECGPKAFGYAAWLMDHAEQTRSNLVAESAHAGHSRNRQGQRTCFSPVSFEQVAERYPWAGEKGKPNGVTLAQMREIVRQDGWQMATRQLTYEEVCAYASEDRVALLCLPAPSRPKFKAPEKIASFIASQIEDKEYFQDGQAAADLGHYMVLLKANSRNAWLVDPENGLIQRGAAALKDLWLRGQTRGLVVLLSRTKAAGAARSGKAADSVSLPGIPVSPDVESAFSGGCCGAATSNNDTGCPSSEGGSGSSSSGGASSSGSSHGGVGVDGMGGSNGGGINTPGLPSRGGTGNGIVTPGPVNKGIGSVVSYGMPAYDVNIYNMNYLIVDTPIWSASARGPALELVLTYNNRESDSARYPIEDVQAYPFGYRWSAAYEGDYGLDPDTNILVRLPNGMEVYFDQQIDGTYLPRDSRYIDHFDLAVATNHVRMDVQKGAARYYFHSLNNPDMQQKLYRIEDRFGQGIDIGRDDDGRIDSVQSDVTGASLNFLYDLNGNVTNVYEKNGQGAATGREAVFAYEAPAGGNSRLASITDMGGYTTTFEYGAQRYVFDGADVVSDHHVVAYVWPNGGRWEFDLHQTLYSYIYREPLQLIITDPEGKQTKYNYYALSSSGPSAKKDRNGLLWHWNLDKAGGSEVVGTKSTFVNNHCSNYREYTVGKRELAFLCVPVEPVDSTITGNVPRKKTWYAYSSADGPRNVTISNAVYERVGTSLQLTDYWVESLSQNECFDVTQAVDRAGNVVRLDRNGDRLVEAVRVQPFGESEKTVYRATYNSYGQLLTYTLDEGLVSVVSNTYDVSTGNLLASVFPDGTTNSYAYDSSTQFLTAFTDRTGQSYAFVRDNMGRPLQVVFPDGTTNAFSYGCCAAEVATDRHGIAATFSYDLNKRLETAIHPMNDETETHLRYGYMGEGQLETLGYGSSDSTLATRSFDYAVTNGWTRLAARITPNEKQPQTWAYGFTGLATNKADGRGVRTDYRWNVPKQRPSGKTVHGSVIGLEDVDVSYSYDALDRLTNAVMTRSDLGEIWSEARHYDGLSRLVQTDTAVHNVPGQATSLVYSIAYQYGSRDLVTNRTLSVQGSTNIPTAYVFDFAVPRLTAISDPYAVAEYQYDAHGRLLSLMRKTPAQTPVTTQRWGYDSYSRLSSLTCSNATALLWGAAYAYDIDRIAAISNRHDGACWNYETDYQGQLTQAALHGTNGALAFFERYSYDAVGNMTARYGMDGDTAMAANADDEIAQLSRHASATLIGQADAAAAISLPLQPGAAVERDPQGNWIAPRVPLRPDENGVVNIQIKAEKSGESNAYRLASFAVNQLAVELPYDENGNLLSHNTTETMPTFSDETRQAVQNLSYDAEGRLASAKTGQSTNLFIYDAAGRRIAKIENGETSLYIWDGMDILAMTDGDGHLTEYYTRGIGLAGDVGTLVAEHDYGTAQTVFLHNNHRGDVVLATDASGTTIGQYEYTPFGNPLATSGIYATRFGFSSKEHDTSDLVYYGFRYYSPQLCRWITPDPLREDGGINLCRFCANSPILNIDPIGKQWTQLVCMAQSGDLRELRDNLPLAGERDIKPGNGPWQIGIGGSIVFYIYKFTMGDYRDKQFLYIPPICRNPGGSEYLTIPHNDVP